MEKYKPIIAETENEDYWWCTCGRTNNQPFCDGSHKGTSYTPQKITLEAGKKVAWCTCKITKRPPFCDGAHSNI